MPRELAQAAAVNASVKNSALFRQFVTIRLTKNMRVKQGAFADKQGRVRL